MARPCTLARPCGRPSCPVCDGVADLGPAGRGPARPADDRPPSDADRRAFYDDLDRFLAFCEANPLPTEAR